MGCLGGQVGMMTGSPTLALQVLYGTYLRSLLVWRTITTYSVLQNVYTYVTYFISATKLKATIYYESECKYSKQFIQEQIAPSYESLKDLVDFVYVPFGKSSHTKNDDGSLNFTCQHGPLECYGNVWELCALDMIGPNQDVQTQFVICDMNITNAREQCTLDAGLSVLDVKDCVDTRGTSLELKAELVTAPIIEQSGKVPTVVYNDIYNTTEYYGAVVDFAGYTNFKLSEIV
ncbi:GILT-like protein 1 [Chironomus tepperi]|uniref:GILT-like protein 1 n=1 Tax=Chironomus tepperi TaxID=113505 RepID=UPI00391EE4B5